MMLLPVLGRGLDRRVDEERGTISSPYRRMTGPEPEELIGESRHKTHPPRAPGGTPYPRRFARGREYTCFA